MRLQWINMRGKKAHLMVLIIQHYLELWKIFSRIYLCNFRLLFTYNLIKRRRNILELYVIPFHLPN